MYLLSVPGLDVCRLFPRGGARLAIHVQTRTHFFSLIVAQFLLQGVPAYVGKGPRLPGKNGLIIATVKRNPNLPMSCVMTNGPAHRRIMLYVTKHFEVYSICWLLASALPFVRRT